MASAVKGEAGNPPPPVHASIPPLTPAERAALKASIAEFGVVVPVVRDQHDAIIEGHNRVEIAAELGVDYEYVTRECTPEERDRLRHDLNTARRQLPLDQWEEMVDHLLSEGHSERAAAGAVGVSDSKVQRHVAKKNTGASPEAPVQTGNRQTVTGADNKQYPVAGTASQRAEVVKDIRKSGSKGVAISDLEDIARRMEAAFTVAGAQPRYRLNNVRARVSDALKTGEIEKVGKGKEARYYARAVDQIPPKQSETKDDKLRKKAEKLWAELDDKQMREEIKDIASEQKHARENLSTIRAFERADEQRKAAEEKEAIRLAKVAEEQALKRFDYWEALFKAIESFHKTLGPYLAEFDDLPPPQAAKRQMIDRSVDDLTHSLSVLQRRLFPGRQDGKEGLKTGNVIIVQPKTR